MTELERFAATLLAQWRADGGEDGGPIGVGALLDRVLPYRVARRILGIDVSEDYEALVLQLLAEEEGLVRTEPVDAADMAKATIDSRLPDLDALQLLRGATVTVTERAIARLGDVLPMPASKEESKWATPPAAPVEETPPAAPVDSEPAPRTKPKAKRRTAEVEPVPVPTMAVDDVAPPRDADVIPLHPVTTSPAVDTVASALPPDFLTTVTFTPPAAARCWSCAESLPVDRAAKFCPFCGVDQRQPTCTECGAVAERGWKHCADCGAKL